MSSTENIDLALRRLEERTVDYPDFIETAAQLRARCELAISGTVILLTGVGGLGVNRIARFAKSELQKGAERYNPYMVCEVDAKPPTEGRFGWRTFFVEGLKSLGEPALGQRKRATESASGRTEFNGNANFRSLDDYRDDFSSALRKRETRVLIVTDAHFMLRTLRPKEYHHAFALLNKIVNARNGGPQVVVLSGSPVIRDMLGSNENPEVTNSSIDQAAVLIDVKAIDSSTSQGKASAVAMLKGFQELLGDAAEEKFLADKKVLQQIEMRTLFVPGYIKKALVAALQDVRKMGKDKIAWSDVKKHLPSQQQLKRLREDLEAAELRTNDEARQDDQEKKEESKPDGGGKPNGRRPGERGPASDPVGIE
ncbi:hypothetical protein DFR24_3549 [Panacagrimonas perspica]|uniref:AAA ATPase-like protein n=1 Tax=Panacagrimonas perspica TaxID=381431 RepID=A0A4R7NZW9_9GAMM|nr:hypothetical protein [Panacagrimonas perspica]TDU26522.1 hypothetical protein DFR24_3549 [Panacagrimonas perspica]THD02130.1 hypothetical protein B1810_16815 [Panacagrimonas perspica]